MALTTTPHTKIYKKKTLFLFLQSYTLLLIIGGIFAHENHAFAAIIASVLCGTVIQVGSWLVWQEKKGALLFNLISVFGLTLFFIYRWLLIRKFYPPGFLIVTSCFLIFKICQTLYGYRKCQKNST